MDPWDPLASPVVATVVEAFGKRDFSRNGCTA